MVDIWRLHDVILVKKLMSKGRRAGMKTIDFSTKRRVLQWAYPQKAWPKSWDQRWHNGKWTWIRDGAMDNGHVSAVALRIMASRVHKSHPHSILCMRPSKFNLLTNAVLCNWHWRHRMANAGLGLLGTGLSTLGQSLWPIHCRMISSSKCYILQRNSSPVC